MVLFGEICQYKSLRPHAIRGALGHAAYDKRAWMELGEENSTPSGKELARCAPTDVVDDLVRLRATTEEWRGKAQAAVLTFMRPDKSFWKDSRGPTGAKPVEAPHITSTARAFIAMLYADRAQARPYGLATPDWATAFSLFTSKPHIRISGTNFTEIGADATDGTGRTESGAGRVSQVNTFDVAHLADFVQVGDYLNRFYPKNSEGQKNGWLPSSFFEWTRATSGDVEPHDALESAKSKIGDRLIAGLKQALEAKNRGEIEFEVGNDESRHYFATLHALRAIHSLGKDAPKIPKDVLENLVEGASSFAVEQTYFFQRNVRNRQDPVGLAFAGCIYVLYEDNVDKELCLSIIQALSDAQQPNGSWPATHPVIREGGRPSHATGTCLHQGADAGCGLQLDWLLYRRECRLCFGKI
jgi:hypothetical protein